MKTTFKELGLDSCFDFDHSGIPYWSGAVGPWRKISPRKYVRLSDGMECTVGSAKTKVIERTDLNY